jgi:uncharacterized integral membrane protein
MRWVYLAVVVLFVAATIIFAAQNNGKTTVSFLGMSVQMPLAFLVVVVYLAGALTGGSLFGLLRKSVQGARHRTVAAS